MDAPGPRPDLQDSDTVLPPGADVTAPLQPGHASYNPDIGAPLNDPAFGLLLLASGGAALVVGFLKTAVGGGIGLVLTPTLTLVLPAPVVLALIAPLLNLSDPLTLGYYWRRWDARQLRVLMPTCVVGVAVGTWALALLSDFWLKKAIGGAVLLFAVVQLSLRLRQRPLWRGEPGHIVTGAVGVVAGVASTVAHSGGIVLGPHLVGLGLSNAAVVATANAVIALSNLAKLGGYWKIGFLTGQILLAAALATPLLVVGTWFGFRANRRLPRRWFELALLAIAVAGALRLLAAP